MNKISSYSVIQSEKIGDNVTIEEFVVIRKNVTIGNNVVIHPHVLIEEGCIIGDNTEIYCGAFIGKEPKGSRQPIKESFSKWAKIGSDSIIGPNAVIYYGTIIGDKTLISEGVSIRENCNIGNNCVVGRNATINFAATIHDNTKIMDFTHITAHTQVDEDVFIGPHVCTADDNTMGRADDYTDIRVCGAHIKKGASIGEGVRLLPCVEIGANSIIGAASLVTRNVPDRVLAMGSPARVKKEL